ncbi:hypothetical protein ES703_98496 [subsurface metagenome]
MSMKLSARLVTVEPYKIADLTAADTENYMLDLSDIVPKETKAVLVRGNRVTGTGNLTALPMGSLTYSINCGNQDQKNISIVPIKDREFWWRLGMANDDWDLILFGYFVQRRTR